MKKLWSNTWPVPAVRTREGKDTYKILVENLWDIGLNESVRLETILRKLDVRSEVDRTVSEFLWLAFMITADNIPVL
jgi:hypothetical protein